VILYNSSLQMNQKSLHIFDEISEKINNYFRIITLCFPICSDLHFKNTFCLLLNLLMNQLILLNIHKHWYYQHSDWFGSHMMHEFSKFMWILKISYITCPSILVALKITFKVLLMSGVMHMKMTGLMSVNAAQSPNYLNTNFNKTYKWKWSEFG
jgi:hypothetical protein